LPVSGLEEAVRVDRQRHAKHEADVGLVVDDQDAGHRGYPSRTCPCPGSMRPISTARWPDERRMSSVLYASSGDTTTTMPRPMLKTFSISSSLTSPTRWISWKMRGVSQVE